MATLISNSTGNFTTAATWSLVDATSLSDLETSTTNTTTAFVNSTAFTPGAITIDGIGIKINSRSAVPTGTLSVQLAAAGVAVPGTTVTINVSSLNLNMQGWVFFRFGSPVTLLGATAYTVQLKSSTNAQVSVFRSATAGDWSRALRTTTNQAPASGDNMYVCGEYVDTATSNSFTVTMNNTAATAFGKAEVSALGTLSYGTSASTAYQLRLGGVMYVNSQGTLNIGVSGTPIPSTSSATLEFIVGSNVQFGLEVRSDGVLNTQGATKTGRAYLAADAAAAATTITSDVSTGWLNGDSVVVASTTRTVADTELKTLTGNATGTSIPISSLSVAHSGTAPTKAELANLTRNVKIFGQSVSLQAYLNTDTSSTVSMAYTEFFFMGSASSNKRGIDLGITTGTCSITGCAMHNFEVASSVGTNFNSTSNANITVSDCVYYRIAAAAITTQVSSATTNSINNCWAFSSINAGAMFILNWTGGSITNITAVSSKSIGIDFSTLDVFLFVGSNWTAHSNTTIGVQLGTTTTFGIRTAVSNVISWRNLTRGIFFNSAQNHSLDTVTAFGNATNNIELSGCADILLSNLTLDSGSTLTCPIGISLTANNSDITVDNSSFGATTTHSTADVNITTNRTYHQVAFRNCLFASSTELGSFDTQMAPNCTIGSSKHDQTTGIHKMWKKFGVITSDTSFYSQQSPSQRLTPNSSISKLNTQDKRFAVPNGHTARVSVDVRKSVVGDGAAYNGNQPRLILRKDTAAGISSDTVLATSTAAGNGAFETLSATTVAAIDDTVYRIYVDCDGTAGWVNCDLWKVDII